MEGKPRAGRPMSPLPATMEPAVRAFVEPLRAIYQGMNTTLVQLETVLHRDSSTLSRYFNGVSLPELEFLDDLFEAFHTLVGTPATTEVRRTTRELYDGALKARDPRRFEVYRLRDELGHANHRAEVAEEEAVDLRAQLVASQARREDLELGLRQLEAHVSQVLGPEIERVRAEHRATVAIRNELEERIRQQTRELTEKLLELRAVEQAYEQVSSLLQAAEARLEQELQQRWERAAGPAQEDPAHLEPPALPQGFGLGPPPRLWQRFVLRSWRIRGRMLLIALLPAVAATILLVTGSTAATVAALSLAAVLSIMVASSVTQSLHTLRTAALEIASNRLPEIVRRLRDTADVDAIEALPGMPMPIAGEMAEVAHAFDLVHTEAVRLATEQAMLRNNVNAMFTNLSRRSQSLVQRQLRLIDELENAEQSPDQLASLFKLDHLATRMRRNGENLLVLAGEEPGRRWSQPVPLIDVLRAAASEVELYERIRLIDPPAVDLIGRAVNDVVHLVAELLENATLFSAPETKVSVTGNLLNTGDVVLEIEDSGIGMTQEQLDESNERLANPPVVDVSISRRMGLFVVGRLATRRGIQVRLRHSATGGVTALVLIPAALRETSPVDRSDTPRSGSGPQI